MYEKLIAKSKKLRQDTFSAFIEHGEAHLGGSFSMVEMLIALYEEVLKEGDKFILSKAHASFPLCFLSFAMEYSLFMILFKLLLRNAEPTIPRLPRGSSARNTSNKTLPTDSRNIKWSRCWK